MGGPVARLDGRGAELWPAVLGVGQVDTPKPSLDPRVEERATECVARPDRIDDIDTRHRHIHRLAPDDDANRTLPRGIQRLMGDQLEDVGMIATGLMIAIVPVIVVYAFFSEKLIQGMTAGAVK